MQRLQTTLSQRQSRLEFAKLLEERERRRKDGLRHIIREGIRTKSMTPQVVEAYASLLLSDDSGNPLAAYSHHHLWLEFLCDLEIPKLVIIAPPESAKTTWTISAFIGCSIGMFPERNTIIGSVSGPVAEKRSLSLRGMVQSTEWMDVFPNILPVKASKGLKWDTMEWSVAPNGIPTPGRLHPTIAAYGMEGSITGSRGDIMLADDLLDFDNTRTEHQRASGEQWFHNSFLPRRKSRVGRVIVIGTAWHPGDIYSKIRVDGSWVVVHTPLLSESEDVYANISYPDNWTGRVIGEPISPTEIKTKHHKKHLEVLEDLGVFADALADVLKGSR